MDLKKKKKKKKFEKKKEQKIVVKARVISSPIHLPGVCVCLIFFKKDAQVHRPFVPVCKTWRLKNHHTFNENFFSFDT